MNRIITFVSVVVVLILLATHPSIGLLGPDAAAAPTTAVTAQEQQGPMEEVWCTMEAQFWSDEAQERGRWRRTFESLHWFIDGPPIRHVKIECTWLEGVEIRTDIVDAPDCDDTGTGWNYFVSQRGEASDVCWFSLTHALEQQE